MKKLVVVVFILAGLTLGYLYMYEREILNEFVASVTNGQQPQTDDDQAPGQVSKASSKPPPAQSSQPSKPAANPAILKIPDEQLDFYVNGEPVEPGSDLKLPAGDTVIMSHTGSQYSLETWQAKAGSTYQPALSKRTANPSNQWQTFQGNGQRTGFAQAKAAQSLTVAWQAQLGETVSCSPIIIDETAYFSSANHLLNAVSLQDGSLRWQKGNKGSSVSPIANAEHVFVADEQGNFTGFRLDNGKERGQTNLDSYALSLALISPEAFLAVTRTSDVYQVRTKKGFLGRLPLKINWNLALPELQGSNAPPLVLGNQAIFRAANGALCAIDVENGKRLWCDDAAKEEIIVHEAPSYISDNDGPTPTPASDGALVYNVRDGELLAQATTDGRIKWRRRLAAKATSSLSLAYGMVLVGQADGHLSAYAATNGTPIYHAQIDKQAIFAGPVILGKSMLVSTAGGKVALLHTFTGKILADSEVLAGQEITSTPAVGPQGALVINSAGKMAYFTF